MKGYDGLVEEDFWNRRISINTSTTLNAGLGISGNENYRPFAYTRNDCDELV
jgi:hypothetical protein